MLGMHRRALVVTLAVASPAHADETPFDRGKLGVSLALGQQRAFDTSYIVAGAGVSYFVVDGFAIGLAAQHDFGNGPSVDLVSPSLRYVAQPLVGVWPLIPYVGVFYAHELVGDMPDLDAVGARAGLLYVSGRTVLGLGIAVARTISTCTIDCTSIYPDVTIGIAL